MEILPNDTNINDRYQVVGFIDRGGYGTVYEVINIATGATRALKILHAHVMQKQDVVQRFEKEVRIRGKLKEPAYNHVIDVSDIGVFKGSRYIVMELLKGVTLQKQVDDKGPLPWAEVIGLAHQLAHALDGVHEQGVIHRDLTPGNLFLTETGLGRLLKVLDFGLASHQTASNPSPRNSALGGTQAYMAPEQTKKGLAITNQTDIFAFGLNVWFALVGEELDEAPGFLIRPPPAPAAGATSLDAAPPNTSPPNTSPRELILQAIERLPPERRAALPDGFDEWLMQCLHGNPKRRFPTAMEAWLALKKLEIAEARRAEPPKDRSARPEEPLKQAAAQPPGQPAPRSRMGLIAAAAGGCALGAIVGGAALLSSRAPEPELSAAEPQSTGIASPLPTAPAPPAAEDPSKMAAEPPPAKSAANPFLPSKDGRARLQTFEVSRGELRAWLDGLSEEKLAAYKPLCVPKNLTGADLPATNVCYSLARDYCKSLGARLPTSAEWLSALGREGWKAGSLFHALKSAGQTNELKPRGAAKADRSPSGHHDLVGNAFELLLDLGALPESSPASEAEASGDHFYIGSAYSVGGSEEALIEEKSYGYLDASDDLGAHSANRGFRCAEKP